jgi:hypothetical protein
MKRKRKRKKEVIFILIQLVLRFFILLVKGNAANHICTKQFINIQMVFFFFFAVSRLQTMQYFIDILS